MPPAGLTGVKDIGRAEDASCVVMADGNVTCWGDNTDGQATPPAGLTNVARLTAGRAHFCALTEARTVTCWGDNEYGQSSVPPTLHDVTVIDAGARSTCARTAAGAVFCWGDNAEGQIVVPPPAAPPEVRVLPTATFTAPPTVRPGQAFTLALANAQVPGHPEATAFTYAFDCGDGTFGTPTTAPTAACSAPLSLGGMMARGRVIDQDGDLTEYAARVGVARGQQTVAITSPLPAPARLGGTYVVEATATSGLPVTVGSLTRATCTVAGTTVSFVGVGPCTLRAIQPGDEGWDQAPRVDVTFPVARRVVAITLGPLAQLVDGTPRAVTTTASVAGAPVAVTYAGQPTAPSVAGSYPVVATVDTPTDSGRAEGTLVLSTARVDVQPNTISLTATSVVTVYVYGSPVLDAQAIDPARVRLRPTAPGTPHVAGGAAVATRNGAAITTVRDFDGDGRPDRMLSFLRADLVAAGLSLTNTRLVLQHVGSAPSFVATDPSPPTIAP